MDCPTCGEPLSGRFCTSCGAAAPVAVPDAASSRVGATGWAVSGVLMVALVLAIALPGIESPESLNAAAAQMTQRGVVTGGPGSATNVDLSTMTPREAADRLFLRVMRAAAASNAVELQNFLPMALGAYTLVDTLDSQGSFRVALLQRIGGLEQEAFATLSLGLSKDPSHLLLLGSALEIAISLGDERDARQYAARMIESFDTERNRGLPEYEENQAVLENLKRRAEELLASD